MFDTENTVSVRPQDTAALIAEKAARIESEGKVYYVRPSQVLQLMPCGKKGTTLKFFGGTTLTLDDLPVDRVAASLGWDP